jgi:hypothetical protein
MAREGMIYVPAQSISPQKFSQFLEIIMLVVVRTTQKHKRQRESGAYESYTQTPGQIESLVSAVIDSLSVHSILGAGAQHATQGGRSKAARGTSCFRLAFCYHVCCSQASATPGVQGRLPRRWRWCLPRAQPRQRCSAIATRVAGFK